MSVQRIIRGTVTNGATGTPVNGSLSYEEMVMCGDMWESARVKSNGTWQIMFAPGTYYLVFSGYLYKDLQTSSHYFNWDYESSLPDVVVDIVTFPLNDSRTPYVSYFSG